MLNLWLFFIGNIIFLFPLYADIYVIADQESGKIYFSVCLFGLSIVGGYITRKGLKFFVHVTKKIAILFDLQKFISERKKLFKIQGVTPLEFRSVTKVGVDNSLIYLTAVLFVSSTIVSAVINEYKRLLSIRNDFTICQGDGLRVLLKFSFVFNLFSVNAILFKGLINKVVKYYGRKKSCSRAC